MTSERDGERRFETTIWIDAAREVVWRGIATEQGLTSWFAPVARAGGGVGEEVSWSWNRHHHWVQRIEAIEESVCLETRYDSPVDDGAGGKVPLFISWRLADEGAGTRLRLLQSGFGEDPAFDEELSAISRGWPIELEALKLWAERHPDARRSLAWSTCEHGLDPETTWERLLGPEGLDIAPADLEKGAGAAIAFTSSDGDCYEGETLGLAERELCLRVASHGDAFLRVSVHAWRERTHVWIWLAGYDEGWDAEAAKARFDAMLVRLFATHPA